MGPVVGGVGASGRGQTRERGGERERESARERERKREKEKITHALDMQSKERVDGRLNAILHVIRVIRNDLKITRGRDESEDFSDWIRYDLANAFPGWRMKLCMAVNTNELIPT